MSDKNTITVGFVGLGVMGASMAANLLKAGYALVVCDKRKEAAGCHIAAGATWADTPHAAADGSDVVVTCLPSMEAIEEVAFGEAGLIAGLKPGAAWFEMSTNSPALAARLARAVEVAGASFLDAPISGGALGARRGRLAIWVGGEREVFDRHLPVLRAMGNRPVHVGAVGAGLVTKLVNNCASQTLYPVLAEIFSMGVKAGADPLALWEAIRHGALGTRRTFDGFADEFLPSHYDPPNAALRIFHKDMTLATELGRQIGAPLRYANLALAEYTQAMNRGWSERDGRSVMLLAQERVGIEIKEDPAAIREVFRRDPPAASDTKHGAGE